MMTVESRHDLEREVTWITVAGELTVERKHRLRTIIGKALVACPRAVIVDLTGFDDPTGTAAPLFHAAQSRAFRDHGAFLLWVLPRQGQLRDRLANPFWHHVLRLYDTIAEAEAAVELGPPPPTRFTEPLEPDGFAPSRARLIVHDACMAWDLPHMATVARRVVFELVHNAATHAATPLVLVVSRRGGFLHLSVRDGDPRPPTVLPNSRKAGVPGDGLHIVDRNATAWGCLRSAEGKIVWAALWIAPPP
ncbi:ATP-binding protein [Dactylosporangium sp. NPDC000244]|uniref:ATP-binding protein n=1 Tax=Dactylosporangium sp. NPDC000244 TaxID=3154365 RepID=UPI00331B097F